MKRSLLSMSLMLASLIGASQPLLALAAPVTGARAISSTAPDPAAQVRATAGMLRSNDLNGLLRALLPPTQYQVLRQAYEQHRLTPTTDAERAEFAQGLAKLNAPGAVDLLMAEAEPKLAEARPQAAGAVMMGLGGLQVALASPDSELSPELRASLTSALPGIQRWATSTDFLSSESLRQALTLLSDAARNTGVDSIDELKMLSFEQVLDQAGGMVAASKQALRIYGLDLDRIADSMRVEVLAIEGASARVRTTVTVFDAPIASEIELVLIDGRWYGKDATASWTVDNDEESEG